MGHGAPEFIDTVAMSLVNSFCELYIQSGKINVSRLSSFFQAIVTGQSELTKFYLCIGS